jgi:hypothetical protein
LHISGTANYTTVGSSYFLNPSFGLGTLPASSILGTSIFASGNIVGSEVDVLSDKRIKNIIGESSSLEDLQTVEKIQVVNYTYKDQVRHGNLVHKKVIAQQVKEVFPHAVKKSSDAIPDIFKKAQSWRFENELELTIVLVGHSLIPDERVRLLLKDKEDKVFTVLRTDENSFVVNYPSHKTFSDIFVYGRHVDDLLNVDYDALSMLNLSATKQLAQRTVLSASSTESLSDPQRLLRLKPASSGFSNAHEVFPELCHNGQIDALKLIPYLVALITNN